MNISDKSFLEKSGKSELYTQSSLINGESSAETIEIDPPENVKKKTNRFKEVLSQILAVSSINLILLDLGMVLALPTIVIPELLKSSDGLKFTEEQASWFGSLAFIFQPLGSAFSGLTFEPVGRRMTMLYVNGPLFLGWLLMRFGTQVSHLYIAEIIMGTSIGLMDAPHITYLGEITQPKWRGILISYAELCVAFGFCIVYFLGSVTDWKTVSSVCCTIPIISVLFISQLPESPIWLLSKGKRDAALKSLAWLRGWVKHQSVQNEFADLRRHYDENKLTQNDDVKINNRDSLLKKIAKSVGFNDILRKSVLQPIFLVAVYFGFSHLAGVTNTRPFMVDILNEFGTPLDPVWVTAISSIVGMIGFLVGMVFVPKAGKRFVSIASMLGCALTTGCISLYGFFFRHTKTQFTPILLFVLLNFIWSCGVGQIPWMLISEVFPFRGRGVASGVVAAISYIEAFIFIKTFYSLHHAFSVSGKRKERLYIKLNQQLKITLNDLNYQKHAAS
ncbi:hypothetical protein RUM43_007062 [Polyplax serrata]|uniref:Major facilitator superfamily (MFS) profile domain-containing protein n=1 Tax=Polyplax serrata TaxID=468196 RepID=A0AAN8S154_POLSC